MRFKLKILFLCFAQICVSQTIDINQLFIDGEKAYSGSDFLLAKEIYTTITLENPSNKDGWFNLAASKLKLGENENACEDFYQVYLLQDREAQKIIQENCPDFRNGLIMSINGVEEKPKFLYDKKEYLLVIGNSLNPRYISLLNTRFKWSVIMSKYKGSISILFQINKLNKLDVKIFRISGSQKEAEIIKKEILSILDDLVVYVSAKNGGINVDLWDKWFLTFNFLMVPSR